MKKNTVYADAEGQGLKIKDTASLAVKHIEGNSFFSDDGITEVVIIARAIYATQLAELEALKWSQSVKHIELEHRIKELKKIVQ